MVRFLSRRAALAGLAASTATVAAGSADAQLLPRRPLGFRGVPPVPDTTVVPPTSVLGIVSGGLSGTYVRIANDIAAVFAERVPAMRVLPIVGQGSLQNISDIMNIRDVDIGIVQSDVLSFLRTKSAALEGSVTYLAKLYDEEVHVLARGGIDTVADLAGKRVNVDGRGSGTALTASVIFQALDIKPVFVNMDQESALRDLKAGQLDALVYVTGKPARLFLDAASAGNSGNLRLLSLPLNPALLETYLPTRFEHADYPALVAQDAPVDTVAVGAVMAVYNWSVGTERFTRLSRFVDAFFTNLPALRSPGHHPKWQQVSLSAQVPGWNRFRSAQLWLDQHGTTIPAPAAAR